jgi:hypothetical protein
VLLFVDQRIEDECETHHESSMWGEIEVCTRGEIVSEQFQMDCVFWVQVS